MGHCPSSGNSWSDLRSNSHDKGLEILEALGRGLFHDREIHIGVAVYQDVAEACSRATLPYKYAQTTSFGASRMRLRSRSSIVERSIFVGFISVLSPGAKWRN